MKTRQNIAYGLLAVLIAFTLTVCGGGAGSPPAKPDGPGDNATVSSVIVTASGNVTSIEKGKTLQFYASVTGVNNPVKTVAWSVSGGSWGIPAGTTYINSEGRLYVSLNEKLPVLYVKATSTVDNTKSGTTLINVIEPIPSVIVTVSDDAISVNKGDTLQFYASVTNNLDQTVIWSIVEINKNAETAISAGGLLTVAINESLTSITVRATSTADNTKNGTKQVTVTTRVPSTPVVTTLMRSPYNPEHVTVIWNEVIGATRYNIYWSYSAGSTNTNPGTLTGTTYETALLCTNGGYGFSNNSDLYFRITAENSAGESSSTWLGPLNPVLPSTPTGVIAERYSTSPNTVFIEWSTGNYATSYRIYRSSVASGSGTLFGTSTTTSFTGTTTDNYFRVSAVNSNGESSPSPWVSP